MTDRIERPEDRKRAPGGGRRSTFSAELGQRICERIAGGHTLAVACRSAGTTYKSFHAWMIRGQRRVEVDGVEIEPDPNDGEQPFRDFAAAVEDALVAAELRHVTNIEDAAAGGDWRASAWWLERRRNGDWGRKDTVDVQVALTDEAKRLAEEYGLPLEVVMAEARSLMIEGPG